MINIAYFATLWVRDLDKLMPSLVFMWNMHYKMKSLFEGFLVGNH